jgi:hypothetical protein
MKNWKRFSSASRLFWSTEDIEKFFNKYELASLLKETVSKEIRDWVAGDPRLGLMKDGSQVFPIFIEYKDSKYREINFFEIVELFVKEKGKRASKRTGII